MTADDLEKPKRRYGLGDPTAEVKPLPKAEPEPKKPAPRKAAPERAAKPVLALDAVREEVAVGEVAEREAEVGVRDDDRLRLRRTWRRLRVQDVLDHGLTRGPDLAHSIP